MKYNPDGKSEVARLMWEIDRQWEAVQRVANDPGFSSKHEAIRRSYDALGRLHTKLSTHLGKERSMELITASYEQVVAAEQQGKARQAGQTAQEEAFTLGQGRDEPERGTERVVQEKAASGCEGQQEEDAHGE